MLLVVYTFAMLTALLEPMYYSPRDTFEARFGVWPTVYAKGDKLVPVALRCTAPL